MKKIPEIDLNETESYKKASRVFMIVGAIVVLVFLVWKLFLS